MYGQIDRNVQALVSNKIDSGYTLKGSKVTLPPSGYTYSDTGMFMDDDRMFLRKSVGNIIKYLDN
jgi:hypothetical protein